MPSFDLLDEVLPQEGRYCILGLGKYASQHFADTKEEAEQKIQRLLAGKFDVYFGCAKYGPLENRTQDNALYFRALWLDIDCGIAKATPDEKGVIKGYIDQATGLGELQRFCKEAKLPRPVLVNSGYGIHCYWLIQEVVSKAQWLALAKRLRELCVEHNLIVDSAVFEPSRVLRVPGTLNFKQDDPAEVKVLSAGVSRIAYESMRNILGAAEPKEEEPRPEFIPIKMSPLMEMVMKNRIKRFSTIMKKGAEGCAQLVHCYQNQETIDYNLWRSALSIAAFCVDKDTAIHKISNQHPDYDEYKTVQKVEDIVRTGGPHHCTTFEKYNPTGCANCPHKGAFKSPISLGADIADDGDGFIEALAPDGTVLARAKIPEYPFPFFRGANGGIYKREKEEEKEPTLVYEHDLYVTQRMTDPEWGEVVWFKLHLPQDDIREFSLPLTTILVKEELRKALAKQGVALFSFQLESMMIFVTSFIKNLQVKQKADIMRSQFGWVEGNSKFILGTKEITKDGTFYSPPSHTTTAVCDKIHSRGTLEKWKSIFNMFARPGLEPNAFAVLTGFGSPLLKFTGMSGAIINVIHAISGSGKSTTLYACNSIIGHPKDLSSIADDTMNMKLHRLGVMNNLANTIDEITNTSAMEFSVLAYSISQGRGKHRMKASSNEARLNLTSWQGITLTSSNASFYQKMGSAKNSPDGESMRLLEYEIKPSTIIGVAEGKLAFDHELHENYGHAGEIYLRYLVDNLEDCKSLIKKVQAKLDADVQLTSRERFWSATVACNIAGGLIARHLGLHDFDMSAIYEWVCKLLREMREDVKPPSDTPISMLGDFLNSHIHNAVVVNGIADKRSNLESEALLKPKGELLVRFEPDTKELWIAAKAFRDECVKRQINYKDLLAELKKMGVYRDAVNKRMSKGLELSTPAVRALHFDTTSAEFLRLDALVPDTEKANDSGDSAVQG